MTSIFGRNRRAPASRASTTPASANRRRPAPVSESEAPHTGGELIMVHSASRVPDQRAKSPPAPRRTSAVQGGSTVQREGRWSARCLPRSSRETDHQELEARCSPASRCDPCERRAKPFTAVKPAHALKLQCGLDVRIDESSRLVESLTDGLQVLFPDYELTTFRLFASRPP
jgi:hypothetical protein